MDTMKQVWLDWLRREEEAEALDEERDAFDALMKDYEEYGGES